MCVSGFSSEKAMYGRSALSNILYRYIEITFSLHLAKKKKNCLVSDFTLILKESR